MIVTSRVCDVHHKPERPKLTTHLELFRHDHTQVNEYFTHKLSSARMTVERAFGRLKGRWRILQAPSKYKSLFNHCNMIGACCVLHNICEMANDPYYAGTLSERYEPYYDDRQHMPQQVETLLTLRAMTEAAVAIRDALVKEMAIDMPANWAPRARQ